MAAFGENLWRTLMSVDDLIGAFPALLRGLILTEVGTTVCRNTQWSDTRLRAVHGVVTWGEWKVVDVAFWTTIASNPSIIGRALVLFIYAYAFSSGGKVRR